MAATKDKPKATTHSVPLSRKSTHPKGNTAPNQDPQPQRSRRNTKESLECWKITTLRFSSPWAGRRPMGTQPETVHINRSRVYILQNSTMLLDESRQP